MIKEPKWPSVEKSVGGGGKGGWPQVEKSVPKGGGSSASAKTSTLERNHPLDTKAFNKKRGQS